MTIPIPLTAADQNLGHLATRAVHDMQGVLRTTTQRVAPAKVVFHTRRGQVTGRAVVGDHVRPGTIWMSFHFTESPANVITNDVFDPLTATAEYKCCAAATKKVEILNATREGLRTYWPCQAMPYLKEQVQRE